MNIGRTLRLITICNVVSLFGHKIKNKFKNLANIEAASSVCNKWAAEVFVDFQAETEFRSLLALHFEQM